MKKQDLRSKKSIELENDTSSFPKDALMNQIDEVRNNTKLIDEFIGNTLFQVNIPFQYEKGEEMPTSQVICKTKEDCMDEVRLELREGVLDSGVLIETPDYSTSWEMLMPVVKKVYSLDKYYEYVRETSVIFINEIKLTTNIGKVYKAVVEFIKWYNENK